MATEILRPILVSNRGPLTTPQITSVPEIDDYTKWNTLINESVPDDSSTYISFPINRTMLIGVLFESDNLRRNYSAISSIDFFIRVRLSTQANVFIALAEIVGASGDNTYPGPQIRSVSNITLSTTSTEWETLKITFNGEDVISAISTSLANFPDEYCLGFCISGSQTGNNNKQTGTFDITQTYIEVTYSDNPSETVNTIYLKENDSWTSIPCVIYQKQNDTWIQIDTSIFCDGQKYILQDLT